MMYKVIHPFTDLINGGVYAEGDTYPCKGIKADEKRIEELSTDKNRTGKPLIKKMTKK